MKKIILALLMFTSFAMAEKKKVLYVTHEPGRWHKYAPQKEIFIELAKKAGWDLTVSTGEHDPQIVALQNPDLTKGYDAVVYNFCFAGSNDLKAASNIITQTREKGVPAMLIHCSMHSFWGTFKDGKKTYPDTGKAKPRADLYEKWKKENPGKPFPAWGNFTGIASAKHGPHKPIKVEKCCEHAATKSLSKEGFKTGNAELYNNIYVTDEVKPLLKGLQEINANKTDEAIVMWQVPQGKSEVIGISLGHGLGEWKQPEFQNLLIDGLNYLLKNK